MDESRDEWGRAQLKALRLLSNSSKSKLDLRKRLLEAGFSEEITGSVLDDMESDGYINDEKMARDYVEYAANYKAHGKRRIIYYLVSKGIDQSVAEKAVNDYYSEVRRGDEDMNPELDTAHDLLLKRLRQLWLDPKDITPKDRERLVGYLMRRGFDTGTITSVFRMLTDNDD